MIKDHVALMNILFSFLNQFDNDRLNDLVSGKLSLKLVENTEISKAKEPPEKCSGVKEIRDIGSDEITVGKSDVSKESKVKNAVTEENFNIQEIAAVLEEQKSVESAIEYLVTLKLKKNELTEIVRHYDIPVLSRVTKNQLIESIAESVVGARLRYAALYNIDVGRKTGF